MLGKILGKYHITAKLGEGGMGEVYLAKDKTLDRDVALKILGKEAMEEENSVKRFVYEARIVAQLDHPNLIHIFDIGRENDLYYFSMEYIKGEMLSQLISRKTKLSIKNTLNIFGQVMSALKAVHDKALIHRDIKSSNIMINQRERAVLMDFGLAKNTEKDLELTASGIALGTPDYMSPEQATGEEVDKRSDIYALGILLFESLTGRLPFTGKSTLIILQKHVYDEPPKPSDFENIPSLLEKVILKCLEKNPVNRYQDLSDMAQDLVRVYQTPELLELSGTKTDSGVLDTIESPAATITVKTPLDDTVPSTPRAIKQNDKFSKNNEFTTTSKKSSKTFILAVVIGAIIIAILAFAILKKKRNQNNPGNTQNKIVDTSKDNQNGNGNDNDNGKSPLPPNVPLLHDKIKSYFGRTQLSNEVIKIEITFKNGGSLEGTIIKASEDKLFYIDKNGKQQSVDISDIYEIRIK